MVFREIAFQQDQAQKEKGFCFGELALLELGFGFAKRIVRVFELASNRTYPRNDDWPLVPDL
jgi:hypothetical protein